MQPRNAPPRRQGAAANEKPASRPPATPASASPAPLPRPRHKNPERRRTLSELAGLRCSGVDLWQREITVRGKVGKDRIVQIGHQAARSLDRYQRARSRHAQAWRPQLWLGAGNREPLTAAGIYQMIARRGRQ
jgi:integrase